MDYGKIRFYTKYFIRIKIAVKTTANPQDETIAFNQNRLKERIQEM